MARWAGLIQGGDICQFYMNVAIKTIVIILNLVSISLFAERIVKIVNIQKDAYNRSSKSKERELYLIVERLLIIPFISDLIFCVLISIIANRTLSNNNSIESGLPIIITIVYVAVIISVFCYINKNRKATKEFAPPGYQKTFLIMVLAKAYCCLLSSFILIYI